MITLKAALILIAVVLFVIDAIFWWVPRPTPWGSRLTPAGLAFFAASFLA